ncbi:MAG: epimerase [Mycobacterium sp.]|jgi:dihydroflavonol-4-reductase|uniref:SDR family oxidoreductase n=1 Tax=Mycobacterium sp. TaxID=1785 RepID=UPI002615275E|nr:aldehyde reductase [Mycobacterium sp.]MCW2660760.1 epimerase [Mycobacterium sp.]
MIDFMTGERVLVTGGSGFLGSHCIVALLNTGYRVRTTVRAPNREAEVREVIAAGRAGGDSRLLVVPADLKSDRGWAEAVDGCDYVLHTASPFPFDEPASEDDVIVPARDGALRVLRAARDAGVRRVVMTSSFAAIGFGHADTGREFTEDDWTNIDADGLSAYIKSKPVAERAAWDFIDRMGGGTELTVINPVGIFGPSLGANLSSSVRLIAMMINDGPVPNMASPIVDVRDVADLHVRAMTHPGAAGQRFIASCDDAPLTMREIAYMLRNWTGAHTVTDAPAVGESPRPSNQKAKSVLGFAPRSAEEALAATARSLSTARLLDVRH